jgi:hypothetical protein
MVVMVVEARKYFKTYSEKQRKTVKDTIHTHRQQEHEVDKSEDTVSRRFFI